MNSLLFGDGYCWRLCSVFIILPSGCIFRLQYPHKPLFGQKWLSQRWTLLIFKGWAIQYDLHPRHHADAPSHPSVAPHGDYSALPVAHSPALAGQKGTSGMTFWSRCKESITVVPPALQPYFLCQRNHGNEILREVTKSLASSPVQSAFRKAEQTRWNRHTCSHRQSTVPYGHAT